MTRRNLPKRLIYSLLACSLFFIFLLITYRFDNKYTLSSYSVQDGVLVPDSHLLNAHKPIYLTEGWDLYLGQLLTPDQVSSADPMPISSYIGEHLNFSALNTGGSPYGQATYRLRLQVASNDHLVLYLPEIYSAFTVFVNGTAVISQGSIEPYIPHIQDTSVTIPGNGTADILIQTANYTHYYSGMTYPPVLGTAQAIQNMLSCRLAFYGFLCFTSLALALFSLSVWLRRQQNSRNTIYLWFGIMAMSFGLRVSYPFIHALGIATVRPLYAMEDMCTMTGIWAAVKIIFCLSPSIHARLQYVAEKIAVSMIAVTVILPLFLPYLPLFLPVYGMLISWYKLTAAFFLLFFTLRNWRDGRGGMMAAGAATYGTGLLFFVLTIGRYEPAYFGWPDEYGSYAMVLCFAVLMVQETNRILEENRNFTENLKELVEERTREVSLLTLERQKMLSELLHDLKTPLVSLSAQTQLIRSHNVRIDENTERLLGSLEEHCQEMSGQIRYMQDITSLSCDTSQMELLDLCLLLKNFHQANQPDIEAFGPDFTLSLPAAPCMIKGSEKQLKRVLQNLVYNALDFTPSDGHIDLALTVQEDVAILTVQDNGCGIAPEYISKIFERNFTTRENSGGSGLGLFIAKTIVNGHGGSITAASAQPTGTVFIIELPVIEGNRT